MPPDHPHPCHGRTLAMQRCFDAIAETGRPIGAEKTLAALLIKHLVRPTEWLIVNPGPTQIGLQLYAPTPEAQRMWDAWKANRGD